MEKVTISVEEYNGLKMAYNKLKELEGIDFDLVRQVKGSLEDLKAGRVRRVANFSRIEEITCIFPQTFLY